MSDGSVSRLSEQTADSVVHRSQHDLGTDLALGTTILTALDSIPGYDIENSDTVIFDHIDLDAVDDLSRPVPGTNRTGQVTFQIDGDEVTVTADGEITIRDRERVDDVIRYSH